MAVEVKYHGIRGSMPVSGKKFTVFGGRTTCVSFRTGDHFIIIDAGTGICQLSSEIMNKESIKKIKLFFTHTHLDHIQGFPFFKPLYDPLMHIDIYGETKTITQKDPSGKIISQEKWHIQKTLSRQQNFIYFPMSEEAMQAKKNYHTLKVNHSYDFDEFQIKTLAMYHPNNTIGFRFDFKSGSFCFCTDVEHNDKMIDKITQFAQGADVLAYDSQYTQEEYDNGKQGWGHSTATVGAKIACNANIKEYHMIHHDPEHDDDMIYSMEKFSKKLFKNSFAVRENHIITY